MSDTPKIEVTTVVDADPMTAFEVFTAEVDVWWKRGPRFRPAIRGPGVLQFEPGVGGRLLEIYEDESTFVFGRVNVWAPGERLVFELIGREFGAGESTEVEVRFEPAGGKTRVTVVHRGWERFPEDHPARHGFSEAAFHDVMSAWWAELLVPFNNRLGDPPKQEDR